MKVDILKVLFFLSFSFLFIPVDAQVKVVASAPEVVAVGDQFRLEYEVNTRDVKSATRLDKIPDFEILYGPSMSSSYSVQIINGKQSSVSSVTYGYTMMAQKAGTFTLPAITVTVDGKNYRSNTVNIKVVEDDRGGGSSASAQGQRSSAAASPSASRSTADRISNKDLFITVTANKSQVYEQEPILLTYRVYTRLDLRQLAGKMPDLKGFMVKEIPLPQQKLFTLDTYNGQKYNTTVWSQYVMFPQQTGKLTIPSIKFDGVIQFINPNVDLLEEFFNGHSSVVQKKKSIMAPALDIEVKPLPDKPENFSGAVGNFTIKSIVKTTQPRENESLNLQVQISGTGNVDLIKAPNIQFPSDFDTYAPKQNTQSKLTADGMVGKMTIDYVAVPKHKGTYVIPPVEFTYFDTSSHTYKTIYSDSIKVTVAKGEKNIYSEKQQEILARSDIRYIKSQDIRLHKRHENLFWNRSSYWLCYAVAFVVFCIVFFCLRRQSIMSGDVQGQRIRGANKAASRRLKKAARLLKEDKSDAFYEETLHALQGYVSDKLSIPMSGLTMDSIREAFEEQSVSQELSDAYLKLLNDCEFFRFSQASTHHKSTQEVYNEATQLIGKLDSILKKKK